MFTVSGHCVLDLKSLSIEYYLQYYSVHLLSWNISQVFKWWRIVCFCMAVIFLCLTQLSRTEQCPTVLYCAGLLKTMLERTMQASIVLCESGISEYSLGRFSSVKKVWVLTPCLRSRWWALPPNTTGTLWTSMTEVTTTLQDWAATQVIFSSWINNRPLVVPSLICDNICYVILICSSTMFHGNMFQLAIISWHGNPFPRSL